MSAVVPRSSTSSGGGSRWCPTPEQVMLLEGMYRGGMRTPTATQIQQITARLSLYGKIQGKNVFYWFQNHRARDRQKLRKKLMAIYQHHQHLINPPYQYSPYLHPSPIQGGVVEDASNCKHRVNKWKADLPQVVDKTCDCPLMTVMMTDGTTSYCTRVPPITLQLFPTTTTTTTKDDDDDLHTTT